MVHLRTLAERPPPETPTRPRHDVGELAAIACWVVTMVCIIIGTAV